jgi:hypothetical protein
MKNYPGALPRLNERTLTTSFTGASLIFKDGEPPSAKKRNCSLSEAVLSFDFDFFSDFFLTGSFWLTARGVV